MNEDKIVKRAEQALSLARYEVKTDETADLVSKVWKRLKGPAEIAFVGSATIAGLAASPGLLPFIAAITSFGGYLWQRENQNNSLLKLLKLVLKLEQKMDMNLAQSTLNIDEFMELFMQFMDIASKSAFDEKQNYLVNLFVNSLVSSSISFSGKQTLFRLHSQISLEEIHILKVFYDREPRIAEYEINRLKSGRGPVGCIKEPDLATELNWLEEEARITCEGLSQLGLLYNATVGTLGNQHNGWRITALGKRFVQWIIEEVPQSS
jgi:hypothetical protein